MKLFHINRDINKIDEFKPRCPKYYNKIENNENRICVSSSIEGCVSALSCWFGKYIDECIEYDEFTEVRVYEFDSNQVLKENLIVPNKLRKYKNVFDAEITGEHWILNQDIKPRESYLIRLRKGKYHDIKVKYSEKERKLNREKGNEDKKEFIGRTFDYIKYEKIDINKYKGELKEFLIESMFYHYQNRDLNSLLIMEKYIEKQLQIRDNCKNEITEIYEEFSGKLQAIMIKLKLTLEKRKAHESNPV